MIKAASHNFKTLSQIRQAIHRLASRDKIKLYEELKRETLEERFQLMLDGIDERLKKTPISEKEIQRIVEETRRELYVQRHT